MDVQVQALHFDASSQLIDHVEKKISKLKTFSDNITRVDVFLRLENMSTRVKEKVTEIKVNVPGRLLFAKNEAKTFEESFNLALDSMIAQIKKIKAKQRAAA